MPNPKINLLLVIVLNFTLFEVGLIANSIGAVIPDAIRDLQLNYTTAALLPFTFFISYVFVSVPAGIYSQRSSARTVVLGSFILVSAGTLTFAFFPHYSVILITLFVIGSGLAATQVPLFPMLRTACGGENLAFFTIMTSLSYGLGSILSPLLYSQLVRRLASPAGEILPVRILASLVAGSYPWVSVYWVFAVVALVSLIVLCVVNLPRLELAEEERTGGLSSYLPLFKNRHANFYALGVFAYVACEQVNSNWLSQFLKDYHGMAPETQGSQVLSWYWALLTSGCLLGMVLMKLFDSRKILLAWSILAAAAYTVAIFGSRELAVICFPLVGMFISVLWPIIVALALNSVPFHHGALMGILMSSTIGGAVGPFVVGWLADSFGLRTGLVFLYPAFAFMAFLGVWARPMVTNATVFQSAASQSAA